MNIEAFSDENFDAATWINLSFRNSEKDQSKEVFVSNLVSKLQLYVQQVNSALEDTSQQVLTGMPRIMKDAHNLQNEALALRSKMSEVQSEITQVQTETGACMANLERLDGLKTKLQVAKQGLQESDGWGRLTTELEDLFERSDTTGACDKLLALQKSLAAQDGLPGQTERETQVEGFKNRLEALASPAVVKCFSTGEIDQSKSFVIMFSNMNRSPQLIQYYRTVQKNMLQQRWSEIIEFSMNSNSTRFLGEFYEFLVENFHKQVKWCSQVFGVSGCLQPIHVLIELLPSLRPSRDEEIAKALKQTTDKLNLLLEFSKSNVTFGQHLKSELNELQIQASSEILNNLSNGMFSYFNNCIAQYAAIEQGFLGTQLAGLELVQNTAADTIRMLGSANSKVFDWLNKSLERCEQITQDCALVPLITVANALLKTFLEKYKKAQQQLNASRSTEQDWSLLQMCITLLQNIGAFKLMLDKLEETFVSRILAKHERDQSADEFLFQYKLSGKREINEFNRLVVIARDRESQPILLDNQTLFAIARELLKPTCEYIHDTTLASVFAPIENHFKTIEPPQSTHGAGSHLPDYSFAPQEFITEVGQYLLTLPQHLEPLLLAPADSLKAALALCDERYCRNAPSADVLLSLISEECCALYQEQIGQIQMINDAAAKQLATDIQYLGSVLEELGLSLGKNLQQTAALLRAPEENYLALSAGCDPKLVTSIRQIRNIVSTD